MFALINDKYMIKMIKTQYIDTSLLLINVNKLITTEYSVNYNSFDKRLIHYIMYNNK